MIHAIEYFDFSYIRLTEWFQLGKIQIQLKFVPPRKRAFDQVLKDLSKNLIPGPRSKSETQIFHTNLARRDFWNRSRSPLDMYLSKSVTLKLFKSRATSGQNTYFCHRRIGQLSKVSIHVLPILTSESRCWAEFENKRTNSARRVYWNRFWISFMPDLPKNGSKIFRS